MYLSVVITVLTAHDRVYFNLKLKDRRPAASGAGGADVIHLSTQCAEKKNSNGTHALNCSNVTYGQRTHQKIMHIIVHRSLCMSCSAC